MLCLECCERLENVCYVEYFSSPAPGVIAPIDSKIEQAMVGKCVTNLCHVYCPSISRESCKTILFVTQDLVKSYLMIAVKEEVEELRERIKTLSERNNQLEYENNVLRSTAAADVLAKISRT